MKRCVLSIVCAAVIVAASAGAASAQVCVTVDAANDTFTPIERLAAVSLVRRQFEIAGEATVAAPCGEQYLLSHVRLGGTIFVVLAGPRGRREATALGLDDLPAVYNQMARSLVTGRPMRLGGVVDRGNVAAAQAGTLRVGSDSLFYARIGYSALFAGQTVGAPSVGLFGYRHELDEFAVDISFFSFENSSGVYSYYGDSSSSAGASWLKLEALHYTKPEANQSPYFGGGLSVGSRSVTYSGQHLQGSGLQGELTAGYETARASTIRMFVQLDAGIPFYELASTSYARPGVTSVERYAPTVTLSIGLGWQKDPHRRP